jgi:single-strand DNA-binding protein
MNLNKVFLVGRLTRDPEIRVMPSGQQVATFGLATDSFYTDKTSGQRQQKTEFHNLVLFGRLAEIASQYLKKGGLALFEGRIQTRSWQDASGVKKYRTEIVADSMQLGPRQDQSADGGYNPSPAAVSSATRNYNKPKTAPKNENPRQEPDIPIIEENDEIDVKNIPF